MLRCSMVALAALILGTTATAQIVFDDGTDHRLTGEITESLVVRNQSRLALDDVHVASRDEAVHILDVQQAAIEIQGGQLGALRLHDGEATVAGDLLHPNVTALPQSDLSGAIHARGESNVTIQRGGSATARGRLGGPAVVLNDAATLTIDYGEVAGTTAGVLASGTTQITMNGGVVRAIEGDPIGASGPAIELYDSALFRGWGGELVSQGPVAQTRGSSQLRIFGGSALSTGDRVIDGIQAFDNSVIQLRNLTLNVLTGSGFGSLFNVNDEAHLVVESGSYRAGGSDLLGESTVIQVRDQGFVRIAGGAFQASLDSPRATMVEVSGAARLSIEGGSLRLAPRATPVANGEQEFARLLTARENASVEISGGVFRSDAAGSEATDTVEHLRVLDEATVTLFGTSFNHPFGDVAGQQGKLSGVLADGSPLDWNFHRDESATIRLVPEPSASSLLVGGIAGSLGSRRRRRRVPHALAVGR